MRRRNAKNAHERVQKAEGLVILNPTDYFGKWHELFGNDNPIHLEIGMGKGNFIIEHARREPNVNFIGIEKFEGVLIQAVTKLGNDIPNNLHFISVDAEHILTIFDKKEIDKLYLNFSDPWPKKKHAKRRLTHKNFLCKYEEILDGEIEFKTDNRPLFEFSTISFNENNYSFLDISFDLHTREEDIITTEYEDKFSSLGQPIYFIKVKKRA